MGSGGGQREHPRPEHDYPTVPEGAQLRLNQTQHAPEKNSNEDNSFAKYLLADTANAHIRSALLNANTTKDVQVAGIGTTKTGYVIRFRDTVSRDRAEQHRVAARTRQWHQTMQPRFGIVVHRTPTEGFDLDNMAQRMDKIMEYNDLATRGYQVEDIAWLKRKVKPLSASASLGIWFDSRGGEMGHQQ